MEEIDAEDMPQGIPQGRPFKVNQEPLNYRVLCVLGQTTADHAEYAKANAAPLMAGEILTVKDIWLVGAPGGEAIYYSTTEAPDIVYLATRFMIISEANEDGSIPKDWSLAEELIHPH